MAPLLSGLQSNRGQSPRLRRKFASQNPLRIREVPPRRKCSLRIDAPTPPKAGSSPDSWRAPRRGTPLPEGLGAGDPKKNGASAENPARKSQNRPPPAVEIPPDISCGRPRSPKGSSRAPPTDNNQGAIPRGIDRAEEDDTSRRECGPSCRPSPERCQADKSRRPRPASWWIR